jgi:intein-encoded DNA endonuclease-like protein
MKPIKTRTVKEYDLIMNLRKKNKLGAVRLSRITNIPKDIIHDWIYRGVKPKRLRKTKFLPKYARQLTPELAYILGVIKGDGCLCKSRRHSLRGACFDYVLVLGVTDREFAEYFAKQVTKWSGFTLYMYVRRQLGKGPKDIFCVRLRSKDVYKFLNDFDLNKLKIASDEAKSQFLKGFYDSEGSVNTRSKMIHVGVVDKETILLVRSLLSSLGITFGGLLEKKLQKLTFYYFIIASTQSLLLFRNLIGFSIERKQESLNTCLRKRGVEV